jgi:NTP pyrophosphatase (non-canonical NTP hydrolase)
MTVNLSLDEIQGLVDEWIQKHGGYWTPLSMLSATIEELGEISREINHLEGFKPKKRQKCVESQLDEELADLIFSIICIANYYNINLTKGFYKILDKYTTRNSNRFYKGN